MIGLIAAGVGCLMFYPAAGTRSYPIFLSALFVLASGITLLQVSANPYVAILGKPQTASSRLTLTQAFNSLGTTVAPLFGSLLILSVAAKSSEELVALNPSELTAYQLAEAAERGDAIALAAFACTGRILGMKLADSVAHSSPEANILFGGLAHAGDLLFVPTKRSMEEHLLGLFKGKVKVIPSSAGPDLHSRWSSSSQRRCAPAAGHGLAGTGSVPRSVTSNSGSVCGYAAGFSGDSRNFATCRSRSAPGVFPGVI